MDGYGEDFEGPGEVHGVELGMEVVEDFDGARQCHFWLLVVGVFPYFGGLEDCSNERFK